MKIIIPGRLAGANEYILKCRTNRVAAASFKTKQERIVQAAVYNSLRPNKPRPLREPVILHYHWFEKDRRRDKDNIAFAHKFVQDAFVSMKLLSGDGWANVAGFTDEFSIDKGHPRIEITIEEADTVHPAPTALDDAALVNSHNKGVDSIV